MTQFRIDVVVDPRNAVAGTKAVKQGLSDLDTQANKTQLLLQRALRVAGVSFAVRQVVDLADSFTNLQNRLRVVTGSQAELQRVTQSLLEVSNRSRSSFESTAELYSRLALATRELGISDEELLKVTESINKAIILSGASAKEANNGLIQLSQGLASGRLTGDELRSTLEQLPVVADVIAKRLGVTRGELRKLGSEGKITSAEIIGAFQDAREELDQRFAKTVPTLGQSFVVLRNNVVAFVGRLNEGTGALRLFGAALRFVGENIDPLVKSLGVLAVTLATLRIAPAIQGFFDLQRAVKEGRAVVLGSVAAINAQNAALAANAAANVVAAQAEVKRIKALISATQQELIYDSAIVGRNAAILAIAATEQRLIPVRAQLTAATAALATAETEAAAAAAVAGTKVTIFSQAIAKAKAGVQALTAAIAANPAGAIAVALAAVISALVFFRNEIKLTSDGVGTLGDFFAEFFDQLGSALAFIGETFGRAFDPLITAVKEAVGVVDFEFADLIKVPALFVDRTIGLFLGLGAAIISVISDLPPAVADIFVTMVNGIIETIEFLPDVFVGVVKTIGQTIAIFITGQIKAFETLGLAAQQALAGNFSEAASLAKQAGEESTLAFRNATEGLGDRFVQNIAGEIDDELIPRLNNTFEGGFGELGLNALNAFVDAADFSGVTDFVSGLLQGAEDRGLERQAAAAAEEKAKSDMLAAQAAQERADAITKLLEPLEREGKVLAISAAQGQREADIQSKLLDIQAKLAQSKIVLTEAELATFEAQIRSNTALSEQIALKERLIPTEEKLAERTRIANEAFASGTITAEMYAQELRNIDLAATEAGKTIGDGFTRQMAEWEEQAQDLASVTEDILVASFSAAEDALVEFATTGQFSFRDFASGLIKDITRIIAKLLILKAIEAIGGGAGSAAGEASGAVTGALAAGGTAQANKPYLVGEDGPEIFTPGQTGSVTPTDQTIEALSNGAGRSGETVVVQAPAPNVSVQTVVVDDPSKVPTGIESPDGQKAVMNVINMNRSNIKRSLS